jgi:NADPH:quinone reductase-like Zn-dependent oxidoreductase
MGLRVVAIGTNITKSLSHTSDSNTRLADSGAEKKALCLKLGAERWIDFKESKDLVKDVKDACDGLGPHCALVTAATVCLPLFLMVGPQQLTNS